MKFSIIIPIYNAEKFLSHAIDSVINQSLDFKSHTEIILVDDGSIDQSKDISNEYVRKYPNHIKYIYSENKGPSNARNIGIQHVSKESQYIGFLDADDYFSEHTLRDVNLFFEKNNEINLAVIPIFHFGADNSPQRLNYRFNKGTRVIDITKEYKAIHFYIGGCFFRSHIFLNNSEFRFNTQLKFWEDALLINKFLLTHKKYGVISTVKYFYRKTEGDHSLVSKAWYQHYRYTPLINNCYNHLVQESKILYSEILPYVQFLIIYHLRHFLYPKYNHILYEVLNTEEQKEFFQSLVTLIKQFDDKYILEQKMPFYYKNYLINIKKYGWPYREDLSNLNFSKKISITHIKFTGKSWYIRGHFKNKIYMLKPNDKIFIKHSEKLYYTTKEKLPPKRVEIWKTVVRDYEHAGFSIQLPSNIWNCTFGIELHNGNKFYLNQVNLISVFMKINLKKLLKKFRGQ